MLICNGHNHVSRKKGKKTVGTKIRVRRRKSVGKRVIMKVAVLNGPTKNLKRT